MDKEKNTSNFPANVKIKSNIYPCGYKPTQNMNTKMYKYKWEVGC